MLTKVFSPFTRVNNNKDTGLGLGLYIVQQIVRAHKGVVTLSSKLGVGTKVTVELPFHN